LQRRALLVCLHSIPNPYYIGLLSKRRISKLRSDETIPLLAVLAPAFYGNDSAGTWEVTWLD